MKERGSFDFRKADDVLCVAWKDNSSVTFLSNFDSVYPLGAAQRYSRREGAKVAVAMPNVVKRYNSNMGGVDTLDSRIQLYHVTIKGKKWYWPIVIWILESFISNSYLIYRAADGSAAMDQLQFRRHITRYTYN